MSKLLNGNEPENLQTPSTPDSAGTQRSTKAEDRLLVTLNEILAPLGYELVHVEVQTHRQRILRLFIDKLDPAAADPGAIRSHDEHKGGIGIEDCALVSKTLDEPLETNPQVNEIFKGATYELEVSSPGVDRPLRRDQDYIRFAGRRVRIHTFRPLSAEELESAPYASLNPRQKNFLGELLGLESGKVRLKSSLGEVEVRIPVALVAKANLDPDFDFSEKDLPSLSGRQKKGK